MYVQQNLLDLSVLKWLGEALIFLIPAALILWLPFYIRRHRDKPENITKQVDHLILALVLSSIILIGTTLAPHINYLFTQAQSTAMIFILSILCPMMLIFTVSFIGLKLKISRAVLPLSILILVVSIYINFTLAYLFLEVLTLLCLFIVAAIAFLALLWSTLFNINQISPHHFYRNRLSKCYLQTPNHNNDRIKLSELLNVKAPYHLINTAVNLPNSKNENLRGRNSDFFLFSKHYCGSLITGYAKTGELEEVDTNLNLGTAMAISGAAASPHMGTLSIKGAQLWLSLLNIRLSYWLPNPSNFLIKKQVRKAPTPLSLWKEMLSKMSEEDELLNLSDGGHIENLAIYELLRRRCRYIIAVDGEADPGMNFSGLMTLIRLASIDFGIKIDIDLSDLAKNSEGCSRSHFALGKIYYGKEDNHQFGYLLYIKSSMTGNEPDYINSYRKKSPSFPHESTADQFFSEEQFEAYRALGQHIAEDLFKPEILKTENSESTITDELDIPTWLEKLASNLIAQDVRK